MQRQIRLSKMSREWRWISRIDSRVFRSRGSDCYGTKSLPIPGIRLYVNPRGKISRTFLVSGQPTLVIRLRGGQGRELDKSPSNGAASGGWSTRVRRFCSDHNVIIKRDSVDKSWGRGGRKRGLRSLRTSVIIFTRVCGLIRGSSISRLRHSISINCERLATRFPARSESRKKLWSKGEKGSSRRASQRCLVAFSFFFVFFSPKSI